MRVLHFTIIKDIYIYTHIEIMCTHICKKMKYTFHLNNFKKSR